MKGITIKTNNTLLLSIISILCLTENSFSVSLHNFKEQNEVNNSSELQVIYANHQKRMPASWLLRINNKENAKTINKEFWNKEKDYGVSISDSNTECNREHYYTDHSETKQKSVVSNSMGTDVELKWSCYDINQVDGSQETVVQKIKDTWYNKINQKNNKLFNLINDEKIYACLLDGTHKNNADEQWHKTLKLCYIDKGKLKLVGDTSMHLYEDISIR